MTPELPQPAALFTSSGRIFPGQPDLLGSEGPVDSRLGPARRHAESERDSGRLDARRRASRAARPQGLKRALKEQTARTSVPTNHIPRCDFPATATKMGQRFRSWIEYQLNPCRHDLTLHADAWVHPIPAHGLQREFDIVFDEVHDGHPKGGRSGLSASAPPHRACQPAQRSSPATWPNLALATACPPNTSRTRKKNCRTSQTSADIICNPFSCRQSGIQCIP